MPELGRPRWRQLMDIEDEVADTLSESGSQDDMDDIKALKV